MVRDNCLGPSLDGLGGGLGRDRQTGHNALHFAGWVAEQQADVVPIAGQLRRSELPQELHDGADADHD